MSPRLMICLGLVAACGSSRSPAQPPASHSVPTDAHEETLEDIRREVLTPTCVDGRMCVAVQLDKCLDLCRRQLVPSAITGGCETDCRNDNCDSRTCTPASVPAPAATEMCLDTDHCADGIKRCLDVCYRRNHPNGPADDRCRQGCYQDYCPAAPCPARP